jgi:CHRD domain
MRKLGLLAVFLVGAALIVSGVSLARGGDNDNGRTSARLIGYEEVPAIVTDGRGSFSARIRNDSIEYTLRYDGLEGGTVLFAHIHIGQRDVNGGVSAFLCGGGGKPPCPPADDAEVEGTITPANVVGPAGQGVAAGEFADLIAAIKAGVAYANVHTQTYPGGEIRGQLGKGNRGNGGGDRDKDDDD